MKKLISTLFLFMVIFWGAAQETEENRFQQSENAATGTANTGSAIGGVGGEQEAVGNPPGEDDVPIDDYLPALVIIGATLIIYRLKSKKIKTL